LQLNQRSITKTINVHPDNGNVAIMWTVDHKRVYNDIDGYVQNIAMNASITQEGNFISTDIDLIDTNNSPVDKTDVQIEGIRDNINSIKATDNGYINIDGGDVKRLHQDHMHELLEWHIRLGHMWMKRVQKLAKEGIIPKVLSTCKLPICVGCLHGKMARQPWRHKGISHGIVALANQPGECVSVDQMHSSNPGLVGQMKGIPTRLRYRVATVFILLFFGLNLCVYTN
jgi:hypothetical protein